MSFGTRSDAILTPQDVLNTVSNQSPAKADMRGVAEREALEEEAAAEAGRDLVNDLGLDPDPNPDDAIDEGADCVDLFFADGGRGR